jgi:hypothetical protein
MHTKYSHTAHTVAAVTALACAVAISRGVYAGTVFGHLLPTLRATGVPVLLPTGLHDVYADIALTMPGYFDVVLGYVPHCGGDACSYGEIIGQRGAHPPHGARLALTLTGARVRLARGHSGYFVPFSCGASCGDSTLTWSERGYRYQIALHAGAKNTAVRLANSAILAGPR